MKGGDTMAIIALIIYLIAVLVALKLILDSISQRKVNKMMDDYLNMQEQANEMARRVNFYNKIEK